MESTHRSVDLPTPLKHVHRILLGAAGAVLVLMMFHICAEAVLRTISPSITLHTLAIVSTWYMIFLTFLPMPYVGETRGYMSVELIDQLAKGLAQRLLRIFVAALSAGYLGILAYLTFEEALDQTQVRKVMETATTYLPIWPPSWALPLALGLMLILEVFRLFQVGPRVKSSKDTQPNG
tara:strand:- start:240 stop:776 length:537 start_codon:yes stop_codon:yes gene_type:complete